MFFFCRVNWEEPVSIDIGKGLMLHSVRPPGSGIIFGYAMNIMKGFDVNSKDIDDPVLTQRMVESFKWAYAARAEMGDPWDEEISDYVAEVKQVFDPFMSFTFPPNTFSL